MAQRKSGRKGPVGGDITDYVPKKMNGAMGFGDWEDHMKPVGKKRRR